MKTMLRCCLFWGVSLSLLCFQPGNAQTVPSRSVQLTGVLVDSRPRIAVLIGNERYAISPLNRPHEDVDRLSLALTRAKFDVLVRKDIKSTGEFERVINELKALMRKNPGAVVVVYYSGHAWQRHGINYLLPTQAQPFDNIEAAMAGSYRLSHFVEAMAEYKAQLQLVMLDACRNNPYLALVPAEERGSIPPGVAKESFRPVRGATGPAARGLQLIGRVQPGATAPDDGHFADQLAEWMESPGSEVSRLLKDVGPRIETESTQPWAEGYISGDFYFQPPEPSWVPSRLEQLGGAWIRQAGGSFMRGSGAGDSDEVPVKSVNVPSFEISRTEVTVAQYRACVEAKWEGCTVPVSFSQNKYCNWEAAGRENHPINCVDWEQARAFAGWVGGRLPTEVEWEFSARGSAGRTYAWGDGPEPSCELVVMNATGVLGLSEKDWDKMGCGAGGTAGVCSKLSGNTAEGLCDMGGNVWEWVEDCYHGNYEGAPLDGSARTSGCSAPSSRVVRGGGWSSSGGWLRAANRNGGGVGVRDGFVGFRVVRSVSRAGVP